MRFSICAVSYIFSLFLPLNRLGKILNFDFLQIAGAFEDPDVTHVEGEVDPVRDLDIISDELRLKDEDTLDKLLEKMERTVIRANDKKLKPEYVSLLVLVPAWHCD